MSHHATNWAMQQRGLKPAAFRVLLNLADRHNPDLGCFPGQERLASDCEMSRSTLNLHLNMLEEIGLIRREERRNEKTKKQLSTRYHLGFELAQSDPEKDEKAVSENRTRGPKAVSEKSQKPCPKNDESRVRNSDTNPVREPVREPTTSQARAGEAVVVPKNENVDEVLKKKLLAAWHEWDGKFSGSEPNLIRCLEQIEPDKREDAVCVDRIKAFRAVEAKLGGPKLGAFSTYIKNHKFEAGPVLDYLARERACAEGNGATGIALKPLGKAWMAHRLWQCLHGKAAEWKPRTAFQKTQYEQNPEVFAGDIQNTRWAHIRFDYPMLSDPEQLIGDLATYQQINRLSPHYEAWETWFIERGYPPLDLPERDTWIWVPCADVGDFELEKEGAKSAPRQHIRVADASASGVNEKGHAQ